MKKLLRYLLNVCALTGVLFAYGNPPVERNIRYREASNDALIDSMCRLDLAVPDTQGFTTVIWFHGGGLSGGQRDIPQILVDAGFAVAGVEYRLTPAVTVADCIDDAAAAAAWVVQHIAEYGGDPRRIVVAGHSAGGYLTSMIGLDKHWLARYGIDPDEAFMALIPYSGQVVTHFTRRKEMGLPETRPLVDEFAPLNHVRPDCPPMLILSGDREHELLGRYEETAYFWRMMKLVGHKDVQIMEFQGFNHGNMPQAGHFVAIRYIHKLEKRLSKQGR